MANVCKRFPREEFFTQHPLPSRAVGDADFDEVRCFIIWAAATKPGVFLNELIMRIDEIQFENLESFDDKLKALLDYEFKPIPFPPLDDKPSAIRLDTIFDPFALINSPLNFSIKDSSAIIIRLIGDFWRFSTSMRAISTKHDLEGHYYTARRHWKSGNDVREVDDAVDLPGHRCISFFSGKPCRKDYFGPGDHVRHGLSFNIDFIMPNKVDFIPVTFDPDVENKGGNPGGP